MKHDFWECLQQLVNTSKIIIDRSKGFTHLRYHDNIYSADYGYLNGTTSIDSGGVDIWVGTLGKKKVVGALGTVDLLKRDTELKILYDCTADEINAIINMINTDQMRAIVVKREIN